MRWGFGGGNLQIKLLLTGKAVLPYPFLEKNTSKVR